MNNLLNTFRNFFIPPIFQGEEEKSRDAKLLHQITLAVWAILLLAGIIAVVDTSIRASALQAIVLVAITLMVVRVLNRLGRLRLASQIIVGIVLLLFTYGNSVSAGEPRPILLLTIIAVLISGLLLGPRGAMAAAVILVLQNTVIIALSMKGLIVPQDRQASPMEYIVVNGVAYLLIGFLFSLALQRIQFSINQLQASNHELQELSTLLEQRVNERTKEIEATQGIMAKRAVELQAVAEIATEASKYNDVEQILQTVVDRTKSNYKLYHVHIYLLDDNKHQLVLAAGAGEVGQQMVSQKRSIPIDHPHSLVARAARTGEGAISNDVTREPDFLPNPLLPNTQSEMAIPIIFGNEVLGVLDVQGDVINRFTDEDIAIKTTLASQVASAIQTARSYNELQSNQALLTEALKISRLGNWEYDVERDLFTFNDQFYSIFRTSVDKVGSYKLGSADYARLFVHPEDVPLVGSEIQGAMMGKDRQSNKTLEHRIIFSDGEIGYISVRFTVERDENGKITRFYGANQDVTERRRLEESNRKNALQQEAINLITQKIQSATKIETALQIAARELGQALGKRQTLVSVDVEALKEVGKAASHE